MNNGKALIFSAPSGSGKTTIVKHLIAQFPQLAFSISATTRQPRAGKEVHGADYYFLEQQDFQTRLENDEFIEWEEVYTDNFDGTLKSEIERIWNQEQVVLFDVDVKGGLNLKSYFGDQALAIFVKAPDIETLRSRLTSRKTENTKDLQVRLEKIEEELSYENRFDLVIVNDDLDIALAEAEQVTREFINPPGR